MAINSLRRTWSSASIRAAFVAALCISGLSGTQTAAQPLLRSELLASGFYVPVAITAAPGDDDHIYVAQLDGVVRVINTPSKTLLPAPFVDLSAVIGRTGDGGMLGITFDPQFQVNRYVYVFYNGRPSPPEDRVLARLTVPVGSRTADLSSLVELWRFPRNAGGHNGGWIGFSPMNGYLYLSTGDGGNGFSFDAPNRSQTIVNEKQGKLLRIDVRDDDFPLDATRNYRVPPSNPFVNASGDDEIWAYGLRNPWKCSFDRVTGSLYIADVGQDEWEELNIEPPASSGGRNYGWRCMEANSCTGLDGGAACLCGGPTLTGPAWVYDHTQGHSITGGYVYRGSAIPDLIGQYVCADFQDNRFWSLQVAGGVVQAVVDRSIELQPPPPSTAFPQVSTFGEGADGELYYAEVGLGRVFKIVPLPCPPVVDAPPSPAHASLGGSFTLTVSGAGAGTVTYHWRKGGTDLPTNARISGTEGASLRVTGVIADDAGQYDVVLTNSCGSVTSASATVSIEVCRVDFDGLNGRTLDDIFIFIAAWFRGDPRCDVDTVPGVSLDDIFVFINLWFAGCP